MRRPIALVLLVGLVAGAVAAPAVAKKKKKKPPVLAPTELKYFLHWDPDGGTPEGCTGQVHMDLEDTKGDTTCSYVAQPLQEVNAATGQELLKYTYPATAGVPFVLDASRKLTGQIVLRGTFTVQGYVQVLLKGMVGGQEETIAEGETPRGNGAASNTASGVDLPGPPAVLPVELELNNDLDKLEVTSLTLELTVRGFHRGGIDYERTPSHIIIPAFTKG